MAQNKPAIIVVSSHVVRGTVGNRAAAFALEVLGYPVWVVPSVVLPWHPGQGAGKRITPAGEQFSQLIDDLIQSPWLGEVGAVLSGYLGDAAQVDKVAQLVDAVKARHEKALYAFDPVMGDWGPQNEQGRLYIPQQQAEKMRDLLLPRADLLTPNPFELSFLAGRDLALNNQQMLEDAACLGVKTTLITSAQAVADHHMANLLLEEGKAYATEHPSMQGPPNGLGDLAAALMLAHLLEGGGAVKALQKTSSSLFEVMRIAAQAGSNELLLEASIESLLQAHSQIEARPVL